MESFNAMSLSDKDYKRWLGAAYAYYHTDSSTMSDAEWDFLAKQVVPEEHLELKNTAYIPGQSLFWLKKADYPEWAAVQ